jgi:hypothetical protein
MTKYGQFKLDDLFEQVKLKFIGAYDFKDIKKNISKEKTAEFNLPLLNAKNGDNGIMYYGRKEDFESANAVLDIVNDGAVSTGNVYPQPNEIGVLYNAYAVKLKKYPQPSRELLIYLATVIQKEIKLRYGYENKAGWEKVKQNKITLPITQQKYPDFAYMENYIREIELARILELVAYLKVTGLSIYELTAEEKLFIEKANSRGGGGG